MRGLLLLGLAAGGAYLMLNQNARNRLKGLAQRSSAGEDLIDRERYGSFSTTPEPAPYSATTLSESPPYASGAYGGADVAGIPDLDVGPSAPMNAGDRSERAGDVITGSEPGERRDSESQPRSA